MRIAIVLVLLAGVSVWAAPLARQNQAQGTIPQVRPVLTWLTAVKQGDQEALKGAFSVPMRTQFDELGWPKVLATYQQLFRSMFGEYAPDDFSFAFDGGPDSGQVVITYRTKPLPVVQVVREGAEWKVNER